MLVKMSQNLLNAKKKLLAVTYVSITFIYGNNFEKVDIAKSWETRKTSLYLPRIKNFDNMMLMRKLCKHSI